VSISLTAWWDRPHRDVLSGLVVAFAMIPEAIAFSGIAGIDPHMGLYGAFLLAVTLAIMGARMAMITSANGSTALLMGNLVQQGNAAGEGLGLQYLLAAGILTGILQIAWGYLRLAHQMRFVPQPVMAGFVIALAILIALAQLPQLGINWFDPEQVTIDMAQAHIWDQSGVSALDQVIRRLKLGGSRVEVVNLNPESTVLFARIGVAQEAGGRGGEPATSH
jgi:SulP family sulfate permease